MTDLTLITPPPGLTAADYDMIEQAVMETARGRWFLLEYARRQRAAETQRLADAVDRLEGLIADSARPSADSAAQMRARAVAERLSDLAWRMREHDVEEHFCKEIEFQAADLRRSRDAHATQAEAVEISNPTARMKPPESGLDAHVATLTRIDKLPLVERLALFY